MRQHLSWLHFRLLLPHQPESHYDTHSKLHWRGGGICPGSFCSSWLQGLGPGPPDHATSSPEAALGTAQHAGSTPPFTSTHHGSSGPAGSFSPSTNFTNSVPTMLGFLILPVPGSLHKLCPLPATPFHTPYTCYLVSILQFSLCPPRKALPSNLGS